MDLIRNDLRMGYVMKCVVFISVWIIAFMLQHTIVLTGHATYCCSIPIGRNFMVIPTGSDYLVYGDWEYQQLELGLDELERTNGYWVRVFRVDSTGPVPDILEWYRTTSYMPDVKSISIDPFGSASVNTSQEASIHQAVVEHAWADPDLAELLPGEPSIRTFEPGLLRASLISIVLYCTFPTIVAWVASSIKWRETLGSYFAHTPEGYCANCGYDCRKLPTPICPECGKAHGARA